jgi:hypothetical protein
VPKIPSVSGDVRVLMDDTADQIASAASESVEVNQGVGQWFEWCGLAEGAVWPVLVVVGLVLSHHPQEMSLIPDEGAVEQFPTAPADPPLYDRVRAGSLHRALENADSRGMEDRVEGCGELGVAVTDQELDRFGLPSRSISRLRACWVTHAPVGCGVMPRIRMRLVTCSITTRT